ncbi:MAG: DMT family transporter [Anaerolineales bacterium]|nr:DMT family transporter [Anaerolineales bacterium]
MPDTIGGLAALGTSILWAATSTFFTFASRELGSATVNRVRLLLATLFLAITHLAIEGVLLPTNVKPEAWFWFVLSGVIGLVLGDAFLFQAFVWIGPRLSMLLMSLAPVISMIFSWIFLAERLTLLQVLGIGLTVLGVSTVIFDRGKPNGTDGQNRHYLKGLLFGLGGAIGQALGLVTSKVGLNAGLSPLSGNLIRMFSAAVIMWLFALIMNQARVTLVSVRHSSRARSFLFIGALTGPFLGVWLSLTAIQHTSVGIASTLMSLPPIFLLPVGKIIFKERIGWRAVVGTVVAISGVAMLFLV